MQFYKQTTPYTCAAASLCMIINHFKPDFKLSLENEFDAWQKTAALPTRGSSIFALATYAYDCGLFPKIIVGEQDYKFPGYKFKSYKKKEIEIAAISSEFFFNKAKSCGIQIECRDFSLDEIKENLNKNKILLLRLIIGILRGTKENKRNPHYLAVCGYNDKKFLVMDPKKGPLSVPEEIFKDAFDKIDDIKRDHRMIIFG